MSGSPARRVAHPATDTVWTRPHPEAAGTCLCRWRKGMAEGFTRGRCGAHFAPGTWTSYGQAWRAPIGRLHWAGAEYAPQWNGYMEGAVRSGEAAAEAIAAL